MIRTIKQLKSGLKRSLDAKRVKDSYDAENAAFGVIDPFVIERLFNTGQVRLKVPSYLPADDFANACISYIEDAWGEPEVNFYYPKATFSWYQVGSDSIVIYIVN